MYNNCHSLTLISPPSGKQLYYEFRYFCSRRSKFNLRKFSRSMANSPWNTRFIQTELTMCKVSYNCYWNVVFFSPDKALYTVKTYTARNDVFKDAVIC